jgi:hypothetical protein
MSTAPNGGHATRTMRSGPWALTRDARQRSLPTKNCPAALCRDLGATREYQSDSSSKRPDSSVVSGWCAVGKAKGRPPPRTVLPLDKGRSISVQHKQVLPPQSEQSVQVAQALFAQTV